jgi:peptidoglycan/xylan/chitin deacetylase (PgdA/CDA1 family)
MVRAIESLYADLVGRPGSANTSFKRPPRALFLRRVIRRVAAVVTPAPKPPPGPALRILAYHRVNDRHPGDRLSVHPLEFRRQMEHLAECGRPVLPLHEAVRRLKGEGPSLPPGAVCLTFDDGYRDNLDSAAPVLERLGFPAAVFLVTGGMGARHTIDRYEGCCEYDTALTWEEAVELRRRGHTLGGHGRRHRELGALEVAAAREEIFGCRDDLRAALGEAPTLFCYPRGSETTAVRQAVAEAGFDVAVTVYPGPNGPDADPLRLHRTEISGHDTLLDFRWKLDGAFDGWHRLQQRLRPRGSGRVDFPPE